MRVFLLGASGLIGGGIASALQARGHRVIGLARSDASAARIAALGAKPQRGDLADPQSWAAQALACDAVIQAAGTFTEEMAGHESRLLDRLLSRMTRAGKRYVATGGIWLFPAAGPQATVESDAMDPTPGFEWAPPLLERVAAAGGLVVHPAAVWSTGGALIDRLLDPACLSRDEVPLAGGPEVRWPLVETEDLGACYAAVLETGQPGESYLAAAEPGTAQEELAQAVERGLRRQLKRKVLSEADLVAMEGRVAAGYARDLRIDGAKARRELNWTPQQLSAAARLERLARAIRQPPKLSSANTP